MIAINVNNVSKNYGFGNIFENLNFVVNDNDKLAIVGQNGSGKSTLLKIIAKVESKDSGTVDIKRNSRVAFLSQQVSDYADDRLCKDILLSAFENILAMEQRLTKFENDMACETDDIKLENLVKKYSNLLEEFTALGGYEINTKINYILSGLKIDKSLMDKTYNTLSGGEKTIINFAQILLSDPDILLLDEPTNHLDIKRMEWLESYLNKFEGCVIIVSHDRYFLDKVAKNIFEIENGKGTMFKGNYSDYVKEKENLILKEFEQYKNQQKQIASMKEAIKRLKDWGERGDNPTLFKRAEAIQKRVDMIEKNSIEKPKTQKALPINFVSGGRSSNECVILENFGISFGDKVLFENVNFKFYQKDKVALLGDNGSGKSTLIKCIMGECRDYSGIIRIGNVNIGYFEQIINFPDPKQTVLQYYMEKTFSNEEIARRNLSKYYFCKDNIFKRVDNLSGGEKIRLKLSVLVKKDVNMLIFDEPTNHIDIMTREILEETLAKFNGAMIIVSHDRFFLDKLATKIVEINNYNLREFDGNYSYYKSICNMQK